MDKQTTLVTAQKIKREVFGDLDIDRIDINELIIAVYLAGEKNGLKKAMKELKND